MSVHRSAYRQMIAAVRPTAAAIALGCVLTAPALAQETIKIGLVLPLTGQLGTIGKQILWGARLYVQQNGDTVAGKKIELIVKDDGAIPDNTKRITQEFIVNDKVNVLAGFGVTPAALAAAPLATQAKLAQVVMGAGTSIITERSPYIVRTSFTLPQSGATMADWAIKNGIKKVAALISDFAPGHDALASFKARLTAGGGEVIEEIKAPLANPDFAPFLQRARDANPDGLFIFVPSGQGGTLMKQYAERGLDKTAIKVIATGDVTDDDQLGAMGDAVLGIVTSHHYSANHPSQANVAYVAYVAAFQKAYSARPNFMSIGGYDGMHLIYEALKKTGGRSDGDSLIEAMKGMSWESPRGPISIDAETRDIIQNVYIRKVEKVDGQLHNVEFATFEAVKDPGKVKK